VISNWRRRCKFLVLDNEAYTFWRRGATRSEEERTAWIAGYERFVESWCDHPGCDWHLIPDIVDGGEQDNDQLVLAWPYRQHGVAVWHMHESFARLQRLIELALFDSGRIAIGSSGPYASVGTSLWWVRFWSVRAANCGSSRIAHAKPDDRRQTSFRKR
jgi:hypothetical protein